MFLWFRSERLGNKQKNEQASNETACRCDIVTERFDPMRNKGGGWNMTIFRYNNKKQENPYSSASCIYIECKITDIG